MSQQILVQSATTHKHKLKQMKLKPALGAFVPSGV